LLTAQALFCDGQKISRFSGDSIKFIGELNTLFLNVSDNEKKLIAPPMEDFVQKWNSEQFTPSRKKMICGICNDMLKKRFKPYPDFINYIIALNTFLNSSQPESRFEPWSQILKKLVADKNGRLFVNFLGFTTYLFSEDLLYQSPSTRWRATSNEYRFEFDSVPAITFNRTDLVCYANDDSLGIYHTKGIYYPISMRWQGQGGEVNWKRAGLDPNQVNASLDLYDIQMRFSKFTADSVTFFHKKYFSSPILGSYTDKVLADITEEKASYPRFSSYDKMIGIANLFGNIDFLGGFSMQGSRVIGFGTKNKDARLFFKKDGRDFAIIRSKSFIIRPDRINSGLASVTIYHDNDSIYHPGLQMKYSDEKKELSMTKDERVVSVSPWFDSWHKIEIYCEAMYWNLSGSRLRFEMMKGLTKESKAIFESSSYYSLGRYERLKGMDEVNPLNLLKQFSETTKSKSFTLEEITNYMQKPQEQVEVTLMNLANRGFLVYNIDDKMVRIKDKLFDFVNAKNGKIDYDVIFFNSEVTGTSNGILNLVNFDLKIQGVPRVFLSDSQQVYIYPKNMELILKKDMDFLFSGKIEAGLFDFYARDCSFEYNKFKINLPFVDSMALYVRSKKMDPKTGQFPLVRVRTVLTQLSGELLIDDPKNKSGLKSPPEYPVFSNNDTAYVNWDKGSIRKGVYKKNKFFFEVLPFTIHSLDVVSTDSLNFTGSLTSAGIFPKIDEPLKVRHDFSLGLEKQTGDSGYQVYGGKGTFFSRIDLSDQGLRGDGTLQYLNSTTISSGFLFLPDSMKTIAQSFIAKEQIGEVEYPSVRGDSVGQFWFPGKDSLIVTSTRKEMSMYRDESLFAGKLALTPKGLSGNGTVKIKDAEMDSRGFSFKSRSFNALIANFRIKSYNLADLTISTKNYQAHFDFDERKGEFKSNVGISKVEFPFNKYMCSMDRFNWMIDNEEIALYNDQSKKYLPDSLNLAQLIDVGYTGSEFVSVHPLQDSLRFFAAKATYNLRTNVINAEDVKIIKVADAAIYPDSGKVLILKDAQMQTLHRAIILANVIDRYHRFYNADVSIVSRKRYSGLGDYDYIDRTDAPYTLHFSSIRVDTSGQTVAKGEIPDSSHFRLSPEFAFKGGVTLQASQKNMEFDGGFRPVSECIKPGGDWVNFQSRIDPKKVQIALTSPLKNTFRETITLAMLYSKSSSKPYLNFFGSKESFSDSVMATSSGYIQYVPYSTEFRIAPLEKLDKMDAPGPYFSLNNTNCMVRSEGKINLGLNSGKVKMESFGMMDYFIIPDSTRLHLSIAFDFPFSDAAMQKFYLDLQSVNLSGVNLSSTPFATAMDYLLDKKETDRLKSEMELVGKFKKFPEQLERTLFLADVWLRYDPESKSYVSYGPIGIGNVQKNQINRYVNGIMEFTRKSNGDDFTIYLELAKDEWYFFNFRNNILQALSSNLAFNDLITEAQKSKAEQNRVDKEAKGFRYTISTDRKKRDFLRKFETSTE